jgi:hypothetical protein
MDIEFSFFLEKRLDIYFLELDYKLLSVLICLKLKFAGVALHDSYVMICDFYSNYGSFLDFFSWTYTGLAGLFSNRE